MKPKFTQQHAQRMYNCLALVHRGLEGGQIRSKPIVNINDESEDAGIQTMNEIVADALSPKGGHRRVDGLPAADTEGNAK